MNNDLVAIIEKLIEVTETQSTLIDDKLTEMKKAILSSKSGNGSSNNSSRNNNKNKNNGQRTSILNRMAEFGSSMRDPTNTGTNKLVSSLATTSTAFTKLIPQLSFLTAGVTALGTVVVGTYEFMDSQLKRYEELASSGIAMSEGLIGVRKSSSTAMMSLGEFSTVITKNSDTITALNGVYGNGIEHFAQLTRNVELAQRQLGLFGLSQEQVADLTAKNIKMQKIYNSNTAFLQMDEKKSTLNFISQMNYMSKAVGKSVDDLVAKVSKTMSSSKYTSIATQLKSNGMGEELATQTVQALVGSLEGTGIGNVLTDQVSKFILSNNISDDYGSAANLVVPIFDKLRTALNSGITDTEVYADIFKDITNNPQTAKELEQLQLSLQKSTDSSAMNVAENIQSLLSASKMMSNQVNNTPSALERLTKNFNHWLGVISTEPKQWFDNMINNAADFMLDLADGNLSVSDIIKSTMLNLKSLFTISPDKLKSIDEYYDQSYQFIAGLFDELPEIFANLGDVLATGFDSLVKLAVSSLKALGRNLPDILMGILKGVMWLVGETFKLLVRMTKSLLDGIGDLINSLALTLEELGAELWDYLTGWATNTWDFLSEHSISEIISIVLDALKNAALEAIESISRWGSEFWDWLTGEPDQNTKQAEEKINKEKQILEEQIKNKAKSASKYTGSSSNINNDNEYNGRVIPDYVAGQTIDPYIRNKVNTNAQSKTQQSKTTNPNQVATSPTVKTKTDEVYKNDDNNKVSPNDVKKDQERSEMVENVKVMLDKLTKMLSELQAISVSSKNIASTATMIESNTQPEANL